MFKITKDNFKYITVILMLIAHTSGLVNPDSNASVSLMFFDIIFTFVPTAMVYFTVEGYYHTHSVKKYITRLFIAGLIASPLESYLFDTFYISFLVNLAMVVLLCYVFDKCPYMFVRIIVYVAIIAIGYYGRFDGIFLVPLKAIIFLVCKKKHISDIKTFSFIGLLLLSYSTLFPLLLYGATSPIFILIGIIQFISGFSTVFLIRAIEKNSIYVKKNNSNWKKLIPYALYPLHFAVLCILKFVI